MSHPFARRRHGRLITVLIACTTVGVILSGGTSAVALGDHAITCRLITDNPLSFASTNGGSSQAIGGYTTSGGHCGTQYVRVSYKTYSGSPVYWTSWKSGKTYVEYHPGNTIVGAQHKPASPAALYAHNFPFST